MGGGVSTSRIPDWTGVARANRSGAAVLGLVFDHFSNSCGPPEYHLRAINRAKRSC